jgi:hypothetical protein
MKGNRSKIDIYLAMLGIGTEKRQNSPWQARH